MSEAPMILGIDVSKSRTGLVFGRAGEIPRAMSVVCAGMETADAAWKLCQALIDLYSATKPSAIFYEAPLGAGIYGKKTIDDAGEARAISGAHTAMALMAMTTAVTLFADGSRIPRRAVNVQSVRKYFVGQARFKDKNEGKKRAKALCELLGWKVKNLDEADAFAVWAFGCWQFSPKHAAPILPRMQAQVAAQFDAPLAEPDSSLLKRVFG